MGLRVAVIESWRGEPCDGLVALHAVKSRPSVVAFRTARPDAPVAVALTGTDLYGEARAVRTTHDTLALATSVILLTPAMAGRLTPAERERATTIVQSATAPTVRAARPRSYVDVCVVGHLRDVKDPFLTARAARLLPASSRVRVTLYGGVHDPAWARRAEREVASNPRFRWRGDRPHGETLRAIARADVLVLTSKAEGGPAVISEALACGTPILATRIDATVGLLGAEYPGLVPVGDERALARMLNRFETDGSFRAGLRSRVRSLRGRVAPARERRAWAELLRTWWPVIPWSA